MSVTPLPSLPLSTDSPPQVELQPPTAAPPTPVQTVKKTITMPRLRLAQPPAQAIPKSPRSLRSPRQPVVTTVPKSDNRSQTLNDLPLAERDDAPLSEKDAPLLKPIPKADNDSLSTVSDMASLPSSEPVLRIRRVAVTIPGDLLKSTIVRKVEAAPSVITSSTPTDLHPGSPKESKPKVAEVVQALQTLIISDAVASARQSGMPAHVDRAYPVAKLPALLKSLVTDRTSTYVSTSQLIGLLFGLALEGSSTWDDVQAIFQEIIRSDSKRISTDQDLQPDILKHAKQMMAPWAERIASVLIGRLGQFDTVRLPVEMLDFLLDCDHGLHAALLEVQPPLHSNEINKVRFTLLNRLLLERYLLPLIQKLKSRPPTQLEVWLGEAIRDALQRQLLSSSKDFFVLSFKSMPDPLKLKVTQTIAAEIRTDELARIEARKQRLLARTGSVQRNTRSGHTRSASDNAVKFSDLSKRKVRESEARKLLADVLSGLDLRGLPDSLLIRINKQYRNFMPVDGSPTNADVLGYLERTIDDYTAENTLITLAQEAIVRVKRQLTEQLGDDSDGQEKVARRASGVTSNLDQAFIDRVFRKEKSIDDLLKAVHEIDGDEESVTRLRSTSTVVAPTSSTSSTPSTSSTSSTSSISSTSSTSSTSASTSSSARASTPTTTASPREDESTDIS